MGGGPIAPAVFLGGKGKVVDLNVIILMSFDVSEGDGHVVGAKVMDGAKGEIEVGF